MNESNQKIVKAISSPVFVGVLFAISLFLVFSIDRKPEETVFIPEERESLFKNVEVEAEAVLVWDVTSQKSLFEKNPETQLPLASLTKVLLAKVAVDNIGRYTAVRITPESLREEGDSGLFQNEEWVLENLIDLTLVSSSNDGSKAIAGAFSALPRNPDIISVMNREAKNLGLNQTYFLNESGLDEGLALSGAYGSARDMVILFEKILNENPRVLEATTFPELTVSSLDFRHRVENTNDLTAVLPGVLASKTGFTDLAGGNLVMAFEVGPRKRYIIALMGSSLEERFSDMEKLYLTLLGDLNKEE